MEKIIESKICKQCSAKFDITDKDLEFYEKVSPTFPSPDSLESGLKKYLIPTPTLCPDCRQQRRLAWRNERKLYKRNCDATGKQIISIYSPDKPYKVYDSKVWWSDSWDAMDYGRDFDFDRGFFEQFEELFREVPKMNLILTGNHENTIYSNDSAETKNCYLVVNGYICENSYYSTMVGYGSKYLVDCYWVLESENCYECISSTKLFNCNFCKDSNGLNYCDYCTSCINCENCFGCANLINKKYYIFNKEYSKDNYFKEIEKIYKKNNLKELIKNEHVKWPFKNIISNNSENVIGNYFSNCNNCISCFDLNNSENSKYCTDSIVINCYDTHISGTNLDLSYESLMTYRCYNSLFTISTDESKKIIYSDNCYNSSNLFGCVGLKNKQYCILNKQYTREEYEILVPQIIEHMKKTCEWGEFFPASISPFGYNETVAMEYYPLDSPVINNIPLNKGDNWNEVKVEGLFNWSLYESPKPEVSKIIPATSLPDNIVDVPDDILNWAIECEVTGRPYRIIKQELEFYRKHNLPIPRRHPDERHLDRLRQRNPRRLFERKCDKCSKDMFSTFGPEREEIVYCDECYEKEVS